MKRPLPEPIRHCLADFAVAPPITTYLVREYLTAIVRKLRSAVGDQPQSNVSKVTWLPPAAVWIARIRLKEGASRFELDQARELLKGAGESVPEPIHISSANIEPWSEWMIREAAGYAQQLDPTFELGPADGPALPSAIKTVERAARVLLDVWPEAAN